jgi:Na+-driven multidrug efflux pump
MNANIISLVIHLFLAFFLVYYLELPGINGIAIAMSVNYFMRFASLQFLIARSRYREDLISILNESCRKHLLQQLKLGLKSLCMGIWQYWSYQMYSVIAIIFMSTDAIAA